MGNDKYISRLIEGKISERMRLVGCVVIQGAKWCGKSTTAKRFAKTVVELQSPVTFKIYNTMASTDAKGLFDGEKPILFDEWQKIPLLWDLIRHNVDQLNEKGLYILTGSATPVEDEERHSGLGRITRLIMRPMSLWESGDSTGTVSLSELFAGTDSVGGISNLDLNQIAHVICRGGWPSAVLAGKDDQLKIATIYYADLIEHDITNVDEIKRNPERAASILRSYARNISSLATNKTIQDDVTANDSTLDDKTLSSYTNALRKLFVIEDMLAWSPKMRSRTATRTSAKRQFVDPSIAVAALGSSPAGLMKDMNTFGFLFESLCVRDLRIYADLLGGRVLHFREEKGLEVDAIIRLPNDDWAAIEIKLGGQEIDQAAANLKTFVNRLEIGEKNPPKFLMVLTGLPRAYKRQDGVFVVPIGCMRW